MHFLNHIIVDGDMSTDLTSPTQHIQDMMIAAVQYVYTGAGSPTGNIILQLSADGITWFDFDSKAISAAGTYYKETGLIAMPYARVFWDRTSGTGVLNVHLAGK